VIVALAAALFFAWTAMQVARGDSMGFDLAVRGAIHSGASPLLTRSLRGVTLLGEPWFLILLGLLLAVILIRRGRARAAVALAAAALGGEILNAILKQIFRRARPEAFFGFPQPLDYSFPSGHAMVSTCFFVALAAALAAGSPRKAVYWALGVAAPLLIGFSRVYLGVHYPTDVLAGYAAGILWLTALFYLDRKVPKRIDPRTIVK
jgi:membrane-associated phospholipid phosphatase